MINTFFTADTHFWHTSAVRFRKGFESVEHMNEVLVENWNRRVKRNDIVYHLGDVSTAGATKTIDILSRLNGNKILVLGNHDHKMSKGVTSGFFERIEHLMEIKVEDADATDGYQRIVLCHFPLLTWNRAHYGTWHLHGHSHGGLDGKLEGRRLDVGVDCHNFAPISYEEVKALMAKKKFVAVDHHKEKEVEA